MILTNYRNVDLCVSIELGRDYEIYEKKLVSMATVLSRTGGIVTSVMTAASALLLIFQYRGSYQRITQ